MLEDRFDELLDTFEIVFDSAHELWPSLVEIEYQLRECLRIPAARTYFGGTMRTEVATEGRIACVMPL